MLDRFVHLAYAASFVVLITASALAGTIIHVPADQPTIQAGINAASNGDTVLVEGSFIVKDDAGDSPQKVRLSGRAR